LSPDRRQQLSEFWHTALRARIGLRIASENIGSLRVELYQARRELNSPELEALFLTPSLDDPRHEIWIVHKRISIEEPDAQANE
jgi:hypothetical protein